MRLIEALRLGKSPRLAFTGAGGKTGAMFCLGREYLEPSLQRRIAERMPSVPARRVILAATTHMAVEQLELADSHVVVREEGDIAALAANCPDGLLLFTGPPGQDGRTAGLSLSQMERILALANQLEAPLLIEADGSRQRPLKAPAAHEPVVPAWVDTAVVVAGLSGLGQPLSGECVHRPELFSALCGLPMGEELTPEALVKVLTHPAGGLQGIPPSARRVVLLSQADNASKQAAAQKMASEILQDYQAVIVADFGRDQKPGSRDQKSGTPVICAQIQAVHERTAGVVLAGGSASRFGQPKQTLAWRGQALVWHAAQAALSAGLRPVVVVTGYAAEEVRAALTDLDVQIVHNPDWNAGQSSSLISGLRGLKAQGALTSAAWCSCWPTSRSYRRRCCKAWWRPTPPHWRRSLRRWCRASEATRCFLTGILSRICWH